MSNLFNDDLHCGQNVNNETAEKLEKLCSSVVFTIFFFDFFFIFAAACGSSLIIAVHLQLWVA